MYLTLKISACSLDMYCSMYSKELTVENVAYLKL